jgi:hypothetical protein
MADRSDWDGIGEHVSKLISLEAPKGLQEEARHTWYPSMFLQKLKVNPELDNRTQSTSCTAHTSEGCLPGRSLGMASDLAGMGLMQKSSKLVSFGFPGGFHRKGSCSWRHRRLLWTEEQAET